VIEAISEWSASVSYQAIDLLPGVSAIIGGRRSGKMASLATLAVACWLCGATLMVLERKL
jgi:hypothetical protein